MRPTLRLAMSHCLSGVGGAPSARQPGPAHEDLPDRTQTADTAKA
jgi:hypothetical protein